MVSDPSEFDHLGVLTLAWEHQVLKRTLEATDWAARWAE
jgi:hypothetical protein